MADDRFTGYFDEAGSAPAPAPANAKRFTGYFETDGLRKVTDSTEGPSYGEAGGTEEGPIHNLFAGGKQGLRDVATTGARLHNYIAQQVPAIASIDRATIGDPQEIVNNLIAQRNAFETSPEGESAAGSIGRFGGQLVASAPVMGPVGMGARALARGAGAAVPDLAGLLSSGNPLIAIPRAAATGGALGGEAAALASGQSDEPIGGQIAQGAKVGALIGGGLTAIPSVGRGARNVAELGGAVPAERAALAQEARDAFGIPVTAPQLGTNNLLKFANSTIKQLPLSGAGAEDAATRQAFNRAVSRTMGVDEPTITQSVMDKAKRLNGGVMNDIEGRNAVRLDDTFIDKISRIEDEARASLTDPEFSVVKRQLDGVLKNVGEDGTISGETYGNLIGKGSPLDKATGNNNSNIASVAGDIKEALRDSLQRSLSPEDLNAYQKARFQYKNMKTIEPLVNKSPDGDISPALLNAQVTKQFPGRAYDASGANPLDRLAKIGQAFLKEPGTSGTSERGGATYALSKVGQALGLGAAGGAAALTNATIPIMAGTAGTLLAGRMAGSYLRSPALANRLIARSLGTQAPQAAPGYLNRLVSPALPYAPQAGVLYDQRRQNLLSGE